MYLHFSLSFMILALVVNYFFLLGSGKTAMASTVGISSDFPYVKIVSCSQQFTFHILTQISFFFKMDWSSKLIGSGISENISNFIPPWVGLG